MVLGEEWELEAHFALDVAARRRIQKHLHAPLVDSEDWEFEVRGALGVERVVEHRRD